MSADTNTTRLSNADASSCTTPAPDALPFLLGANTHHGTNLAVKTTVRGKEGNGYGYVVDYTINAFEKLGLNAVRAEFPWSESPGYVLPEEGTTLPPGLTPLREQLAGLEGKAEILGCVFASNSSANNGMHPETPDARARFASRAASAARIAGEYSAAPYIELWNEWNIGGGLFPPPGERKVLPPIDVSAQAYVDLVKVAAPAVRKANPNARIVVGAAGDDYPKCAWTKAIVERGVLDYADALSIHVYGHWNARWHRRGSWWMIEQLEIISDYLKRKGHGHIPLLVTEAGWPDYSGDECGFTPQQRIAEMAQFFLWLPKLDMVKGVWVYELKNKYKPNKTNNYYQDKFGLLDYEYIPKKSLCGFIEAVSFLRGTTFKEEIKRDDTVIEMVYSLQERKDGKRPEARAIWDTSPIRKAWTVHKVQPGTKAWKIGKREEGPILEGVSVPIDTCPLLILPADNMWDPPAVPEELRCFCPGGHPDGEPVLKHF